VHPDGVKVNWSPTRCKNESLLRIMVSLSDKQCEILSPSYLNIPALIVSLKNIRNDCENLMTVEKLVLTTDD
jgi:hypothetical protein